MIDLPFYMMADVFGAGFGQSLIPLRYKVDGQKDVNPAFSYSGLETIGADDITKGESWLGTPINFKFGIDGGSYNVYNAGRIEQKKIKDFQFPLTTMVTFSRSKRDRITPVSSGRGSVKELYAFNDWSIRIQGICLFDPGHPQAEQPTDQRKLIAELEGLADSVKLTEDDGVFTDLGIYRLYIRSVRFGQFRGRSNQLPFDLTCLSDEPLELDDNGKWG